MAGWKRDRDRATRPRPRPGPEPPRSREPAREAGRRHALAHRARDDDRRSARGVPGTRRVHLAADPWRDPGEVLVRRLAPLLLAAGGIFLTNLLFSAHNTDPAATTIVTIGPLRLTQEGFAVAAGLGARVLAIVAIGSVFALTTDATGLADSLVQQGRLSPRFAYGALAAYQAVPRLVDDLATIRAARRVRGLREWHPRILLSLLVRAIRHADQLALGMDARAFGSGRRSTYRPLHWGPADLVVGAGGLAILVVALLGAR
jgi:energy-coupling factor transport system permease protein